MSNISNGVAAVATTVCAIHALSNGLIGWSLLFAACAIIGGWITFQDE